MGKAIESIAPTRGHQIIARVDVSNPEAWDSTEMKQAEVAIEFTGPETAPENLLRCFDRSLPVVCGSTGWLAQWDDITHACQQKSGALLYASNFSVGVNIFFALNQQLAHWMASHPEYRIELEEIHHTEKKDAPSGTAITLAEQIINQNPSLQQWINEPSDSNDVLPIHSKRVNDVPGTHRVHYRSGIDTIEITHTAHNRIGFATGALLAAEFLAGKQGLYTMGDVLGLGV